MPSFKHRLDRLDAEIPKPVVPPPEVEHHWKRVDKLFDEFRRQVLAAWTLWSEEEQNAIRQAWNGFCEKDAGPLRHWLGSLEKGTSRLARLAPGTTAALVKAWLSPE